jgi:predicted nucleic acid binding AN1-type Zn finger protein
MNNKCDHCNKKAGVMPFSCRCDYKKLCTKCRLPEKHNCTFDYIKLGKEEILKSNPVIVAEKLTKI